MQDDRFTRAALLERVLGDEDIASQIIELVLTDIPIFIQSLNDHLNTNDLAQASGAAHRLKGVAANIGATTLSDLAAHIDSRCRGGSSEGCDEILRDIHKEFEYIKGVLV